MNALTPHAFDAIIAQIARKSDHETTAYADVDGVEREFTAFYSRELLPLAGMDSCMECCDVTVYTLVGAWIEDGDTRAVWAGDRAEMVALLGEKQVDQMEWSE